MITSVRSGLSIALNRIEERSARYASAVGESGSGNRDQPAPLARLFAHVFRPARSRCGLEVRNGSDRKQSGEQLHVVRRAQRIVQRIEEEGTQHAHQQSQRRGDHDIRMHIGRNRPQRKQRLVDHRYRCRIQPRGQVRFLQLQLQLIVELAAGLRVLTQQRVLRCTLVQLVSILHLLIELGLHQVQRVRRGVVLLADALLHVVHLDIDLVLHLVNLVVQFAHRGKIRPISCRQLAVLRRQAQQFSPQRHQRGTWRNGGHQIRIVRLCKPQLGLAHDAVRLRAGHLARC